MKESEYGFKAIKNEQTGNKIDYFRIEPNSQFYTSLQKIKESLKYIQAFYEPIEKPNEPNHCYVKWPHISIEEILIGIDNTIMNGYDIAKKIN